MSRKYTFKLTLSNNVTEKEGVKYLVEENTGFFNINLKTKKQLLDKFDIPYRYLQSFDLIYIPRLVGVKFEEEFVETHLKEIIFVELKTTKKYLPDNPKGFFFGATENEFNFGKLLGDKFRFCFVSLHEKSPSYALLTVKELEEIIRNKRIQYQINI